MNFAVSLLLRGKKYPPNLVFLCQVLIIVVVSLPFPEVTQQRLLLL